MRNVHCGLELICILIEVITTEVIRYLITNRRYDQHLRVAHHDTVVSQLRVARHHNSLLAVELARLAA
jgi:hypothetical protein